MPDNDPLITNTVDQVGPVDHRNRARPDPVRGFYRRLTRLKLTGLALTLTGLAITVRYLVAFLAFVTAKGLGEHWFAALIDLFIGVGMAGATGNLLWETRSMNKFSEADINLRQLPPLREGYHHLRNTMVVSASCQAVAAGLLLGGAFST